MLKSKNILNLKNLYQNNVWTEQNFKQLYPVEPEILTAQTFLVIALHFKGNVIKVKVPCGVKNANLPYIFHKEIYKFLLNTKETNPLLQTAQVVGFESLDNNLLLDYQISIGEGTLQKKTSFNCIQFLPEGKLNKYKIYKCLAIGGFSKVYLVRSLRDGQFYAMKVMLKKFISSTQKESIIENEKSISSQLNHPFIVRLNHAFETTNFVCFVLDYCPGGQLFYYLKKVKRMSQQQARFYFIEILYGLLYLHQNKIVYRDLKPENLLINYDGHIKIADFGLSKQNMDQKQKTYSFCGSTQYMPPQMILREGHSYGVDFYTLGALLYELVTGLPPFYSKNQQQIKESIVNEELSFPDHVYLSNEIKSLLSGLLHKNQKMRIGSLKGLKQILFHPWVGKVNSNYILSKKMNPPYIPPIDEFNFDENELGDDEVQFTQALICQHLIPPSKEKLIYKNFEFLNERPIQNQFQAIYDKYKQKIITQKLDVRSRSSQRRYDFKKSHSMSNLKSKNSRNEEVEVKRMKKMASSPYLKSALNSGRNKTLFSSSSKTRIFRSAQPKADTLTPSFYQSNLKQSLKNYFSPAITSTTLSKSIYNQSIRMSKDRNEQPTGIAKKSRKQQIQKVKVNNPFIKKKKFNYQSIQHLDQYSQYD